MRTPLAAAAPRCFSAQALLCSTVLYACSVGAHGLPVTCSGAASGLTACVLRARSPLASRQSSGSEVCAHLASIPASGQPRQDSRLGVRRPAREQGLRPLRARAVQPAEVVCLRLCLYFESNVPQAWFPDPGFLVCDSEGRACCLPLQDSVWQAVRDSGRCAVNRVDGLC